MKWHHETCCKCTVIRSFWVCNFNYLLQTSKSALFGCIWWRLLQLLAILFHFTEHKRKSVEKITKISLLLLKLSTQIQVRIRQRLPVFLTEKRDCGISFVYKTIFIVVCFTTSLSLTHIILNTLYTHKLYFIISLQFFFLLSFGLISNFSLSLS